MKLQIYNPLKNAKRQTLLIIGGTLFICLFIHLTKPVHVVEVRYPEIIRDTVQIYPKQSKPVAKKVNHPAKKRKRPSKTQQEYINRFAKVAQSEMTKFGIPASISLAQGLLESRAGKSRLATENNNHFGIKCFAKKCGKGHCSNFHDDSHKDFFRKYPNAWESWRAHSNLLIGKNYKMLLKHGTKDYKSWAYGLKRRGYATLPTYAEKLIELIENFELYKYDRL